MCFFMFIVGMSVGWVLLEKPELARAAWVWLKSKF